ncbi:MAG: NUDIX domain-containing protein [Candidatus Acidiferrum sp.]|jgi:predicted NUDIX family NTP pyrophosphohydrolase
MAAAKSERKLNRVSAGLLMYRLRDGKLEVLLVHLGGPYWNRKDAGAWFVPKGGLEEGEAELAAARREFQEETGMEPREPFLELGSVHHKSGKRVIAWAFRGDGDPGKLRSNLFKLEWPPKSGKFQEFPEIDRAEFFTLAAAAKKMHPAEFELVQRLEKIVMQGETAGSAG